MKIEYYITDEGCIIQPYQNKYENTIDPSRNYIPKIGDQIWYDGQSTGIVHTVYAVEYDPKNDSMRVMTS